jgi:muconolactone delta-isomerase
VHTILRILLIGDAGGGGSCHHGRRLKDEKRRIKIVLIFVDIRVDPKEMSQDELWEAWEEEAKAVFAAKDAGKVVAIYKVCAQRRILALLDVESHDELDQIWMAGVPMARYLELKEVLPVREYEAFADDVKQRWQQQTA